MRLKMLKELFSAGVLRGATVIPSGNNLSAWKLMVHKLSGESVAVTVAAKPEDKIYIRLNAALMDAHRLGFRDVAVQLPEEFEREDSQRTGPLR